MAQSPDSRALCIGSAPGMLVRAALSLGLVASLPLYLQGCVGPGLETTELPARIDYVCANERILRVARSADRRTAKAMLGGRELLLMRVDSAAQEKYSDGSHLLYLQGERAMLERDGQVLFGPQFHPVTEEHTDVRITHLRKATVQPVPDPVCDQRCRSPGCNRPPPNRPRQARERSLHLRPNACAAPPTAKYSAASPITADMPISAAVHRAAIGCKGRIVCRMLLVPGSAEHCCPGCCVPLMAEAADWPHCAASGAGRSLCRL